MLIRFGECILVSMSITAHRAFGANFTRLRCSLIRNSLYAVTRAIIGRFIDNTFDTVTSGDVTAPAVMSIRSPNARLLERAVIEKF